MTHPIDTPDTYAQVWWQNLDPATRAAYLRWLAGAVKRREQR